MKKITAIVLLLIMASLESLAANIRGLIVRNGPYGVQYPVPGLTIMVRNQINQDVASPAVTGTDGMYYFYGMFPGGYYLDVYTGYLFMGRFVINIENTLNVPGVFSDIPLIVIQ